MVPVIHFEVLNNRVVCCGSFPSQVCLWIFAFYTWLEHYCGLCCAYFILNYAYYYLTCALNAHQANGMPEPLVQVVCAWVILFLKQGPRKGTGPLLLPVQQHVALINKH